MKGAVCHSQRLGLRQTPPSSHKLLVTPSPQAEPTAPKHRLLSNPELNLSQPTHSREEPGKEPRTQEKTERQTPDQARLNLLHVVTTNSKRTSGCVWGFARVQDKE